LQRFQLSCNDFNPLVPTSTLVSWTAVGYIYEPLLQYDMLKPGTVYPWLATSATWSNHDKTLTFQLRRGVTWSDGVPFTSKDVVFTFDLLKKYPSLNAERHLVHDSQGRRPLQSRDKVRQTVVRPRAKHSVVHVDLARARLGQRQGP
jgi:peptide/nickel transport system substrate-binding protein